MSGEPSSRGQIFEFLRVLRRRYWQIVLPALFVLTIGSAFAVIVPKKYVVDTRIEIRESRNERDYLLRNPQETATAREIYNIEEHIRHFNRVRRIVEQDQKLWPEYVKADNVVRTDIIKTIIKNIEVGVVAKNKQEGSTFVDIKYRDIEPQRAEEFLRKLTDAWIDDVVTRDLNKMKSERDVLQNQVRETQEEFNVAARKYIKLAQRMGVSPGQPLQDGSRAGAQAADWHFSERDQQKSEREDVYANMLVAQRELGSLEERFDKEPEERREVKYEKPKSFASNIASIEQQKLAYRNEQRRLKPANSTYKKLESKIQELDDAMQEMLLLEREGTFNEEWVPNEKREALRKQRDDKKHMVTGLVARLESLDTSISDFERETSQRTEDYGLLIELAEERGRMEGELTAVKARLSEKDQALGIMDQAYGQPFEIARPPVAGRRPTEPNPMFIIAFSLFIGLALGFAIALLLEYGKNSYRTVYDLASVTTVPVLGSIGMIVTRAEARRGYVRKSLVGASSAVLLGGVSWLTWVWHAAPDKLPVEVLKAIEGFQRMLM
jgi:uncharacterized protein involved in exopolysaccharide biosynthesis